MTGEGYRGAFLRSIWERLLIIGSVDQLGRMWKHTRKQKKLQKWWETGSKPEEPRAFGEYLRSFEKLSLDC